MSPPPGESDGDGDPEEVEEDEGGSQDENEGGEEGEEEGEEEGDGSGEGEGEAAQNGAAENKKTRIQLAAVLGISISQARCATHLKQNLGDKEAEAAIRALRLRLKALEAGPEHAKKENADEEMKALRAEIAERAAAGVRISSETPIAAAVIWDDAVKELLRHGMSEAVANGEKMVEVGHLHSNPARVEQLRFLPLYDKCEAWQGFSPAREEELKRERAEANRLAKARKDARKAAGAGRGRGGRRVAEEPAGAGAERTKTTFNTYVDDVLQVVKKDDPYKGMRVSGRVRDYVAELITQGLARLAVLAKIIVHSIMGVRTMNADHIKAVVNLLMTDERRSADQVAQVIAHIDEKLAVYHAHVTGEKEKKALALDDEKRAELAQKKHDAELARKKKQAENAEKRATEALNRAKALRTEFGKLDVRE